MNSRNSRKLIGLILLTGFLLACVSPLSGTPAPTSIPEAKMRQTLEAVVVRTAVAAQTQTETARPPTLTPTITQTPSKTPTQPTASPTFYYSLFTATFEIQVEETNAALDANATSLAADGLIDIGGYLLPIIPEDKRTHNNQWRCVVRYSPKPTVSPGQTFSAYWAVANSGWNAWTSNTIDFVYKGGYHHDGRNIQDISSTVGFGKILSIGATFVAPKRKGEYHSHYMIKVDATQLTEFCSLFMTFYVD